MPGYSGPMEGTRMTRTAPTLTLRGGGDLVVALPYLLGYQPRDALVLVCLRAGQVCMTAHQPLPRGGEPPPALDSLLAGMAKADPDSVIILGYENDRPLEEVVNQAATASTEVGVRVHDRVIVTPHGWLSLDTGDSSDHGTTATSGVAELVGAGLAPLSSRDALTAAVQQTDEAARVGRHIARYLDRGRDDRLELFCSAWPVVLDTGDDAPEITPKVTARAVLALVQGRRARPAPDGQPLRGHEAA